MVLRLVLVGAGHAHLALIARADRLRAVGIAPILISPPAINYSGLASGVLSGALEPGEATIDVRALAVRHGMTHHLGEMTGLDRAGRRVVASDGSVHPYDLVSLNIGSAVHDPDGLADRDAVWPVKPLAGLFDLRRRLEQPIAPGSLPPDIVVAGDGQTGFEIAAALLGLHERHGVAPRVTLVGTDPEARFVPGGGAKRLTRALERRGLRRLADRVTGRRPGECRLASGRTLPCDDFVLATGLRAPAVTAATGLALDDQGRIRVTPTLASLDDPQVFAVGDCAVVEGYARPFAGVFGVHAAPVLLANLCATAAGRPGVAYVPQARWLSIMDLGDGTGLAMRGRLWWFGRSALALKRRLDCGFVSRSRA